MKAPLRNWVVLAVLLPAACSDGNVDDNAAGATGTGTDGPHAPGSTVIPVTGTGTLPSASPSAPTPSPLGTTDNPTPQIPPSDAPGAPTANATPEPAAVVPSSPATIPSSEPAPVASSTAGGPEAPPPVDQPSGTPSSVTPEPTVQPSDDPTQPGPDAIPDGPSVLGQAVMSGEGTSDERYSGGDVTRNGQNYYFMSNGWGPGFDHHVVSWEGTSFTIESMEGTVGSNYEPASYPTVFCGNYSSEKSKECGLPAPLADIEQLRTGWRWDPGGNSGEYNAAYDIWLGDGDGFAGFAMVWLRDPPGQQPAGQPILDDVEVANVPGTWDVWQGTVFGSVPIINWVRNEGEDMTELEFDIMDFVRDAEARGLELPGNVVNAVAVGFEIWQGPVTNLVSEDFYLDVVLEL